MTVSFERAKAVRDKAVSVDIQFASDVFGIKKNTVRSYIHLALRVDKYDDKIIHLQKLVQIERKAKHEIEYELIQKNDKYNKLKAEFEEYKNRGLFARIINK